jgi:putative transcriptional regulator
MFILARAAVFLLALILTGVPAAFADEAQESRPLMLLATPELADPVFGQTVLLTAPLREGARIGVILNRPTERPMQTLFPDHKVLNQIKDNVYFGGPMLPEVMVLLVRSESDPGQGALKVGNGLFLALSAPLIEKFLKEDPTAARCFVGSVIWQAGELDQQIKDGAWTVVQPDLEMVFSKNPEGLWESLQHKAHQLTAQLMLPRSLALAAR